MDLIPDLPHDLATECLLRVNCRNFPVVSSICKAWRCEIRHPDFGRRRKATSNAQKLFVMTQDNPYANHGLLRHFNRVHRVTVLEPVSGDSWELPGVPEFPNGLPLFCSLASAGSDLVVMGGWDPVSLQVCNSVLIFNFVTGNWRRGTDMPGARRSFFSCASDRDRAVYVAGGHDEDKNALRSGMMYDVAEDNWVDLPEMYSARDECKAFYRNGKFHVIGGYVTERQGEFKGNAESFDVATWKWGPVEENFTPKDTCRRISVADEEEEVYVLGCDDEVSVLKNDTWTTIGKLPDDVCRCAYMEKWKENVVVIGCESKMVYMLDLSNDRLEWSKVTTPLRPPGHVHAGCSMEI